MDLTGEAFDGWYTASNFSQKNIILLYPACYMYMYQGLIWLLTRFVYARRTTTNTSLSLNSTAANDRGRAKEEKGANFVRTDALVMTGINEE
jgi:hypothetical protein